MNLKTITFDADSYQLVPKTATKEMKMAGMFSGVWVSEEDESSDIYLAMLAAAPQPPEVDSMATASVSPWLPIGEFEQSPTLGACWVQIKDIGVILARCDKFLNSFAIYALGSSGYMLDGVTYVMPITKPQAPTGATAPEVE